MISTQLLAGVPVAHVVSDVAPPGFEPLEPDLEDVYFYHINTNERRAAA